MKTKILALVFFVFFGCLQHRVNEQKITDDMVKDTLVVIDLEENLANLTEISLSQIGDSIRYIELETLPGSHIGKILNYQVYPELILVNCLTDVFLFDHSGHFLQKIGSRGMGPQEFIYADWVDYANDTIVIATKRKLLFFSKSGEFLYKISRTKEGSHACLLSNNRIALNQDNPYGNEPFRLSLINRVGDSIRFFKTTETYNLHQSTTTQLSSFEQHFYRQHSKVFYRESYNDTIFRISSDNRLVPAYHIKLGKYKIPVEHRLEYLNDEKKFAELAASYLTFRVEESDHYLFLNYHSRNKGLGNYSSGFSLFNKAS